MWRDHTRRAQFLQELLNMGFAQQYYELCRQRSAPASPATLSQNPYREALQSTGLRFKYFAKEHFYRHQEMLEGADCKLHVSFTPFRGKAIAEFGAYFSFPDGDLGGTYHMMALEASRLADPQFYSFYSGSAFEKLTR